MNSPGDDIELKRYLDRDSELSRRYAATSTEEPPAALDDAVLAQARAAIEASSTQASRLPLRRHTRWTVPFAVAATVLLSFAIFREAGVESDFMLEEGAAPGDQLASVTATAPAEAETPTATPALTDRSETQVAEARREAPAQAKAAESVASAESNAAPAAPPAALLAAAPEAAASEPAESPALNAIRVATSSRPPPAAPPTAYRARSEADAAAESRTPEAWLDEIRKFRADGEITAAEAQLKLFLEEYPDYFVRNPEIARP